MKGPLFLSTDLMDPGDRSDFWRAVTRPFFDTQLRDDGAESHLEGSIRSRFIGSLSLGQSTFNPQRYRRDQRLVRQSGLDHSYLIQLRLSGRTEADFAGRAISIEPGDVTIFDLGQGWASIASAGSTLSVGVPREQIDKAAGGRSLHGTVMRASLPVTRLLADFIISLYRLPADLEKDALAIKEAAVALFASMLGQRAFGEIPDDPLLSQVLRRRVLEFIDAHLARPDLGPALLMRHFRVSRAHLYRIFAAAGGVTVYIRDRRLDTAYRTLTRSGSAATSITTIAHELGFSSSGQFLRAFRARFDMTPSEARQESVRLETADQPGMQSHLIRYSSLFGPDPAAVSVLGR